MADAEFHITTALRVDPFRPWLGRKDPDFPFARYAYMLAYHRDRLMAAARDFSWPQTVKYLDGKAGLRELKRQIAQHLWEKHRYKVPSQPIKVRPSFHTLLLECLFLLTLWCPPLTKFHQVRILLGANAIIRVESEPIQSITSLVIPQLAFPTTTGLSPKSGLNASTWHLRLDTVATVPTPETRHKTTARQHYAEARARCHAKPLDMEVLIVNPLGEVMEGTLTTPYFWRGGRWITPAAKCGGNLGTTRRYALEKGLAAEGLVLAKDISNGEIVWLSNGVRAFGWGRVELGPYENN